MAKTKQLNSCVRCRIIFDRRNGNICTDYNCITSSVGCNRFAACPKKHEVLVCGLYYTIGCEKSDCKFKHPKCIHKHSSTTAQAPLADGISAILAAAQATAWSG